MPRKSLAKTPGWRNLDKEGRRREMGVGRATAVSKKPLPGNGKGRGMGNSRHTGPANT